MLESLNSLFQGNSNQEMNPIFKALLKFCDQVMVKINYKFKINEHCINCQLILYSHKQQT